MTNVAIKTEQNWPKVGDFCEFLTGKRVYVIEGIFQTYLSVRDGNVTGATVRAVSHRQAGTAPRHICERW